MEKHQYRPGLQCKCYGSGKHGKLEECARCAITAECKAAFVPQSYNHPFIASSTARSTDESTAFDEPSDTAVQSQRKSGIIPELPELLREIFGQILYVTNADPVNIVILLGRLGGATREKIRKKIYITEKNITARAKRMAKRSPAFETLFHRRGIFDEMYLSILDGEPIDMRRCDGITRKTKAVNTHKEA